MVSSAHCYEKNKHQEVLFPEQFDNLESIDISKNRTTTAVNKGEYNSLCNFDSHFTMTAVKVHVYDPIFWIICFEGTQ